jgi:hypothetical protein
MLGKENVVDFWGWFEDNLILFIKRKYLENI